MYLYLYLYPCTFVPLYLYRHETACAAVMAVSCGYRLAFNVQVLCLSSRGSTCLAEKREAECCCWIVRRWITRIFGAAQDHSALRTFVQVGWQEEVVCAYVCVAACPLESVGTDGQLRCGLEVRFAVAVLLIADRCLCMRPGVRAAVRL